VERLTVSLEMTLHLGSVGTQITLIGATGQAVVVTAVVVTAVVTVSLIGTGFLGSHATRIKNLEAQNF
jgi:hypothetical protein